MPMILVTFVGFWTYVLWYGEAYYKEYSRMPIWLSGIKGYWITKRISPELLCELIVPSIQFLQHNQLL